MKASRAAGLGVAAGAAAGLYALYEPYRFRFTRIRVPLAAGRPALSVLHISDTHLNRRDTRLKEFLRSLPARLTRTPDVVAVTGDLIEGDEAIEPLVECLEVLDARVGRFFVFGSHDYFASDGPSYTKYFTGRSEKRRVRRHDSDRLERLLAEAGWKSVINRTEIVHRDSLRIRVAGVDDPYLRWHTVGHIQRSREDDLAIGLVHAPDVVSEWVLNGFDLVLAGHTHAGQVRVPGAGAVVTNCSLPNALAGGLEAIGAGWLHVSPGLGSGRFTPIRFNCRPEATLLELEPLPR